MHPLQLPCLAVHVCLLITSLLSGKSHTRHRRVSIMQLLLLVIALFHCTSQCRPVLCFCHRSSSNLSSRSTLSYIETWTRHCELAFTRPPTYISCFSLCNCIISTNKINKNNQNCYNSTIPLQHYTIIRWACIPNQFGNGPSAILDLILAHHLQSKLKTDVLHSDILPLNSVSHFSNAFHLIILRLHE